MRGSHITSNGNGNGSILGRGIKRRELSHYDLVELAADSVSGVSPVVPSIQQAPFIFEGVSRAEISEVLKRREANRKEDEAEDILFRFFNTWKGHPLDWRVRAVQYIGVDEVWDALAETTK
jgi:hypothetical protein